MNDAVSHVEAPSSYDGAPGRVATSQADRWSAARWRTFALDVGRLALARARSVAWWLDVVAVAFVVRIALVLARPLTYSPMGYDEKFYVYGGYSFLHGQVPYRDFQNMKGPLVSLTEALGVAVFGLDDQRFRLMPLTLTVGGIAALVAALIQRGVLRFVAIGVGLLVTAILVDPANHETTINDTESILLGYYCLGVACLLVRAKTAAPWSFMGGVFLGATVLVKENFVITAAAAWLMFLFLPRSPQPGGARASYAKWSLVGGGGLGVLMTAYLASSGGLKPYLELIRVYPTFARTYCVTLGWFKPGPFWSERGQEWKNLSDHLLNFPTIGPWLPLIGATIVFARRDTILYVLASVATFFASMATICIGHCFWMHYFVLGATGLLAMALPGADAISRALRSSRRPVKAWAGVATLAGIASWIYPRYSEAKEKHPAPVRREVATDVKEAINRYVKPGDYILTTGTPDLYFLTNTLGAHQTNGFVDQLLVMYPGNTDAERVRGMRRRLEATRPHIVVIDSSSWAYPQRSVQTIHALVDAYLNAHHYVAMGRVWVRPDLLHRAPDAPPLISVGGEVTFDVK